MRALPHRLAAVWFADIVGYGRLSSRNENEALHLVQLFQRACRDVVRGHDGRLVKFIGDAAMAEFTSTEAAVRAACALEPTFRARAEASKLTPPQLHVGLHVGEIASAPDGDLYGEGLNLASRLQDLAGPGQVLVSEDVRRQLHHRPEFRFIPIGDRKIKDMDEPISVFSVVERPDAAVPAHPGAASHPWRALHREMVHRQVYFLAAAYFVLASVVVAGTALLLGRLEGPEWVTRGVALVAVLGLPVVVLLAWTFEVGRAGLRRYDPALEEPGARARPRIAYVALGLVVAGFAALISFVRPPVVGELPELPANRVAVLYFDDISPERRLGYLVDGLTEALINELSGVRGLEVVSRNGVKPFQNANVPVDSVARALTAGTLVQGSVSESEGRLRVTVQLIDGASGTVLDRDAVERTQGELFALQDDLADRVARFLRRRLGEEIRLAEMRAGTTSVDAWELVQRAAKLKEEARPLVESGTLDDATRLYDRADSLLIRARAADSTWAQPVIERGWLAYDRAQWYESHDPARRSLPWIVRGLEHAQSALEIEPDNAEALELRGSLHLWRALFGSPRDPERAQAQFEEAEQDLRAAVEADPGRAGAWNKLTIPLAAKGELDEMRVAAERAYEADAYLTLPADVLWRLFTAYYDLNEPAEAERWCRELERRLPGEDRRTSLISGSFSDQPYFIQCQIWLMTMPGVESEPDRAWSLLEEYDRVAPPHDVVRRHWNETAVAAVLARAGLSDSAVAVAVRARTDDSIDPGRNVLNVEALVRTIVGQEAEAVGLLSAYLSASPAQRGEVANTWWFERLHDRPEFQALVGAPDSAGAP
jgi:class 3 adenylate cyclase/TolB-like protein